MSVVSVTEVRNALRCPRIFALGRRGGRQVSFPVGSSSLGAPFHRIVARMSRVATAPPRAFAELAADASSAQVARGISAWLIEQLVQELGRNSAFLSMPAEVDDLAEALRQLAAYLAARIVPSGKPPAAALGQLLQHAEESVEAPLTVADGVAVVVRGQIDSVFDLGSGQTEVVEYKLTDEANEELDHAQVALYRTLLRRTRNLDATPVILRFTPQLKETRLDRRTSDALVEAYLLPLLAEMAEWEQDPLGAPATERQDLCAGCPLRRLCAQIYQEHLQWRDDPPAGGLRHGLDTDGEVVVAAAPEAAPAAPLEPDRDGAAEGELLKDRVLSLLHRLGVNATVRKSPGVGPRLVSVDIFARGQVKRLDQAAEDVIHSLESEHDWHASYEKAAGVRRFTAQRLRPRRVELQHLVAEQAEWLKARAGRFTVGEGLDGNVEVGDLSSPASCHLLVGGMSGSGKSVFLRGLIASMTAFHSPQALRFTLVDPKRISFGQIVARGLSDYLSGPVCHDVDEALRQLDGLVDEMEHRYLRLERVAVEDIDAFNEEVSETVRLPHHVVVVDEFADLMVTRTAKQKFLDAVQRLGAKARAAGIHLVLATQRPDASVVPGIIKANLSGRIALRVQSATNSRIVLDQGGAESLLGHGDLLADLGQGMVRAQAPFVP